MKAKYRILHNSPGSAFPYEVQQRLWLLGWTTYSFYDCYNAAERVVRVLARQGSVWCQNFDDKGDPL